MCSATDLDLILINDRGRRFGIRIVEPGMRYGLDDCVTFTPGEGHHSHAAPDDCMVEFYDHTYAGRNGFGPRGQFVSRYYASTLRDDREQRGTTGLDLMGYEPAWKVDADVMRQVYRLIDMRGRKVT